LQILLYGSSREQAFGHRIKSEVPMLNTPNQKIPHVPSDKQLGHSHPLTNGTGPISNLKQASNTGLSPYHFVGNGPHKKKTKPKPWSKEEDANLTAGVYKCGEGKWLDILHKYSFDNTRCADQLSQVTPQSLFKLHTGFCYAAVRSCLQSCSFCKSSRLTVYSGQMLCKYAKTCRQIHASV
jgi:hypothetical protein